MARRSSPLHDVHAARGAEFTEFGGWEMPVAFDSIRAEHAAVRESVGIFDVSHMGQIEVRGRDAEALMRRLVTNDPGLLDPGDSQYAMITDEDGIILDDTVVYRRGADAFLFVPNAGHDGEMHDRWTTYRDANDLDATVENATEEYAMFAVQGPDAADLVTEIVADPVADLSRFEAMEAGIAGVPCWAARTGYTGEDGFEFILPVEGAAAAWDAFDCQPCGLGARDTLRIEAGFLLSGQDFHPEDEPRTPYEADVAFTVKLDHEFVGRDALERVAAEGVDEKLVGLQLIDRGVPRHGYEITTPDSEPIGTVTSGTMSPTLGEPIGLGYVPVAYAEPGTKLRVVIRGDPKKAKVRATPFIDG